MTVLPSIDTHTNSPHVDSVVPSLHTTSPVPTDGVGVTVDERPSGTVVVRVTGSVRDADVSVLAETLSEASVDGRSLVLDLSSVSEVAPGLFPVVDAAAIGIGRWDRTLAVVISPSLGRALENRLSVRVSMHRSIETALEAVGDAVGDAVEDKADSESTRQDPT